MRRIAIRLVASLLFLFPSLALAQVSCGEQPKDLPPDIEESIKGDVQGKAQLFTKLLGNAELKGAVEASKKELQQKYKNVDKAQMDRYMAWVSCQNIMQDKNLPTEKKNSLWLDLYREIMRSGGDRRGDGFIPAQPSFAVTFKGDEIWIVNKGAPEENLSIKYVALAWLWMYGPPAENGCKPNQGASAAEALAVDTYGGSSSDGRIRTYSSVYGIRKTVELLPRNPILANAKFHVCNYELEYSIALSYDDREGRPQRRYYAVDWAARRSPERRGCRKINKEEYDEAASAYDFAVKSGSQWAFDGDPKRLDALVTLLNARRGTMARGDAHSTGADAERIQRILFPEGRPRPRPCEDTINP